MVLNAKETGRKAHINVSVNDTGDREIRLTGLSVTFSQEEIPDHLGLELISRERNQELLEKLPHRDYLDLAVILVWYVTINGQRGKIIIDRELMSLLDNDFDTLYDMAWENIRSNRSVHIAPIDDVMRDLTGLEPVPVGSGLYYMTLDEISNGSVAMLFPDMLRMMYEQIRSPYYLIPSSIHEVLAVSTQLPMGRNEIRQMIREVNREVLSPEEVLSDSLYCYEPERGTLELVSDQEEGEPER